MKLLFFRILVGEGGGSGSKLSNPEGSGIGSQFLEEIKLRRLLRSRVRTPDSKEGLIIRKSNSFSLVSFCKISSNLLACKGALVPVPLIWKS